MLDGPRDMTDRELVELARHGDVAAVGELFLRYWRAARAAAFGVTGDFASAEDAAAEAFTHALTGLTSLRDPDRFGAWLRTIVVRKARLRIESRFAPLDASAECHPDQREPPDATLERRELAIVIQQAIRDLPEPLREAIALFYFEGYDSDAAAQFLEIPHGTLRRRLHDGRTQLRRIVQQLLGRSKPVNDDRHQQLERLTRLVDDGEVYRAIREGLALRPPPAKLIDLLARRHAVGSSSAGGTDDLERTAEFFRTTAARLLQPSGRTLDPRHPVGSVAKAIRDALPDFEQWHLDAADAAVRFVTQTGEYRDRLRIVLPPGFAEGHPGAFVRATRAWVVMVDDGALRTVYEQMEASPDAAAFRAAQQQSRMSDVLELTWMITGVLELRSVQQMLEKVSVAVLPGSRVKFSGYDEPRYRAALQLHLGDLPARAACGGVLADWPGRPAGVDAAHLRLFLEPWATVQSGQRVEFQQEAW